MESDGKLYNWKLRDITRKLQRIIESHDTEIGKATGSANYRVPLRGTFSSPDIPHSWHVLCHVYTTCLTLGFHPNDPHG